MKRYIYILKKIVHFFPYLRPYWWKIFWLFIALLLISFTKLIDPLILKYIVDTFFHNITLKNFTIIVLFYVVIFCIFLSLTVIQNLLVANIGNYLILNLRKKLLDILLNIEYKDVAKLKTGDFLVVFDEDITEINKVFTESLVNYVLCFLGAIFSLYFMFYIDYLFAFFVLFIVTFLLLNNRFWGKTIVNKTKLKREKNADVYDNIQNIVHGNNLKNIHITARDHYFKKRFLQIYKIYLEAVFSLVYNKLSYNFINETILKIGHVLVIGIGGYLIYKHRITLGGFFALWAYANSFKDNIGSFVNFEVEMSEFVVSSNRLEKYFNLKRLERKDERVNKRVELINVDNLDFSFKSGKPVLTDISIQIKKGDKILIFGESGGGKTTLLNIIAGLLVNNSMTVNGLPFSELDIKSYRYGITYVPQDVFIFGDSIREYLTLGNHIDEDRLIAASEVCNMYDFILDHEKGFDYPLEKGGKNLSGGQKQRLALTRAVLQNPSVLIMDEPTSGLDEKTEEEVLNNIFLHLKDTIIILVSHNLKNMKYISRGYRLESRLLKEVPINGREMQGITENFV